MCQPSEVCCLSTCPGRSLQRFVLLRSKSRCTAYQLLYDVLCEEHPGGLLQLVLIINLVSRFGPGVVVSLSHKRILDEAGSLMKKCKIWEHVPKKKGGRGLAHSQIQILEHLSQPSQAQAKPRLGDTKLGK